MFKVLVILIFFIRHVYADTPDDLKSLEEETKRIEEYRRPCLKEVGLYSDSSQPVSSPTINQIFCLWACLYKKNGSIKSDGTVDETVIRQKNPDLDGPLNIIIRECELQAGANTCKLAGCLAKAHLNLLE